LRVSDPVALTLARHRAFWDCAPADRPLIGTTRWSQISLQQFEWGIPVGDGTLEPDMLDVDRFLPQYEALFDGRGPLDGDLVWPAMPPTAIPWLEGMLGCPIRYSLPSGSFFAEPIAAEDPFAIEPAPLGVNPWFLKLIEFIEGLARVSRGRFAVGLPLTRGPWDLVSAACGATDVYVGLYDRPGDLQRLAARSADLWVGATRRLRSAIPRWHGGFVSFLGIWGPTFNPMPQDDASVSVSAGLYRRVMARADRRVARTWKRPIFHLHSAGLQVLDDVLDNALGALRGGALNVDIDPSGPSVDALLPALRRVQARQVALHLLAFDVDQARTLATELAPAGLAVTYQPVDPARERWED
jgi:hypothetical protein